MKKLLLAFSLAGFIAGAHAHSMEGGHAAGEQCKDECPHQMMGMHKQDPAEHAAQLQKSLQLSDEQTAKVKKVFEDKAQQHKALEEKYAPQFEAFRGDMKKLHEQTHTQLNGILTPKQQEALKAQHKSHGGMCPRSGKHMHDGHHDHDDSK